ncbi:AraC family transcriptional regulator [Pseudoalteromonas sp. Hal040]|uniref:AraC family transcriptional regulator n=1 Tax=Pseudoalteromonas sp. Hal040 TaxID=3035157 RepID=UPI00301D9781
MRFVLTLQAVSPHRLLKTRKVCEMVKFQQDSCAVVRHNGSHDTISDTVYYLYREWLVQSGEEVRDFPCFFHYLNLIHEVDECDLQTDIYLPIK